MNTRQARLAAIILGGLMALYAPTAEAQYFPYYWAHFEDARLPPKATPIGDFFESTVRPLHYSQAPAAVQPLARLIAHAETRQGGLGLYVDETVALTGLGTDIVLERDLLREQGAALFQADFFIPPAGNPAPSLAVLAMAPLEAGVRQPSNFYRFGVTKDRAVYFSYVDSSQETANVFEQDTVLFDQLPRPGWHRFALIFTGEDKIHCYVDGREAEFSPLSEPTLRRLQVGLMLADRDNSYVCLADNLSIQYSVEDAPLPESPYVDSWQGVSQPGHGEISSPGVWGNSTAGAKAAPATTPIQESIEWMEPEAAWQAARTNGQPLLAYFVAPRLEATRELDEHLQSNPAARQLFEGRILAKINVNRLEGGSFAQSLSVLRVPTIVLLNSSMQEEARAVFRRGDTWESLASQLGLP